MKKLGKLLKISIILDAFIIHNSIEGITLYFS